MVSGKAVWFPAFQERLGFRLDGGFGQDRVVSGRPGKTELFPARLCGFTKVCATYDVGSLMV